MSYTSIIAMAAAVILFILGLVGTILPLLPGSPLILAGMVVYGAIAGFDKLSAEFFVVQGIALALTFMVDYAGTAIGAKKYGGSSAAALGAAIGLLVGPLVLSVPGIVIGPFVGALAAEVLRGRDLRSAARAAFGTLVGLVGSTILKLVIEIGMIVWFLWTVLAG